MTAPETVAPTSPPADGMRWVPPGTFAMGSEDFYPEERPVHPVRVDGFWNDEHPVAVRDFRRFVKATGYVTVAERPLAAEDYPDADPELLVPGSLVFRPTRGPVSLDDYRNWWSYVPGACWHRPDGPASDTYTRGRHPVTQVAFEDAAAYAAWAGKELPSEAEWERAARGGLEGAEYAWGDELTPGGRHMANVWQGEFPMVNLVEDGWEYTAPVRSFPPNGYGLFQVSGNVWEWTTDWYQDHTAAVTRPCCTADNPRGATREASVDGSDPAAIPRRVMKGGSHLCAPNYCRRYRPAARMAQAVDTSTSHLGFRCIVRPLTPRG